MVIINHGISVSTGIIRVALWAAYHLLSCAEHLEAPRPLQQRCSHLCCTEVYKLYPKGPHEQFIYKFIRSNHCYFLIFVETLHGMMLNFMFDPLIIFIDYEGYMKDKMVIVLFS